MKEEYTNATLSPEALGELIRESDDRWFSQHKGPFNYQEHVEFTASYIAANYNRKLANIKRRKGNCVGPIAAKQGRPHQRASVPLL